MTTKNMPKKNAARTVPKAKKEKTYKLDPRNARTHPERNKSAVEKSLRELGAGRSIVVDASGVVIGGNAVYEEAIKLGIPVKEIETSGKELIVVRRVDLKTDDPRRKALALADNQISTLAEWDDDMLGDLLGEIEDIDLDVMGFEDLEEPEDDSEATSKMVDKAAELLEKWEVERGQIWEIPGKAGTHRVMCGDSTDTGDVEVLLDGVEPYLMVTDPPYGVEYDPNWRNEAAAKGHISYAARRIGEVSNDDRTDWGEVFRDWPCKVLYSWSPPGDHIIETGSAILAAGFQIRSQIIWRKTIFAISRGHYHWRHEPCWYAVRKGNKAQWIGDRSQSTVWDIKLVVDDKGDKGHGTQKPIECMARPIRNHEGQVADPFLGSGTTVVAAEQEGRVCYGMELEPKYVAVVLERMALHGLEPVKCDG